MARIWFLAFFLISASTFVSAADPHEYDFAAVEYVAATRTGANLWDFAVAVRHNDEGWGHYAREWQVVDPENDTILGSRVLAHPHVGEQPFTRSLAGIVIPGDIGIVVVRARCDLHGWGGRTIRVDLTREEGEGYRLIERVSSE